MKKITVTVTLLLVICIQAQNFTGTWNSTFGELRLVQDGQIVYGDYGTKGIMDAIQTGNTINGKFTNNGNIGEFSFKLSADHKSFTGQWKWQNESNYRAGWSGTLKSDSYPSLKMDKWTAQYEFKSYPNGFIKKLNLIQKGFNLEGKFDDNKSFIGKLNNDLKTVLHGSFYHGNTQYNVLSGNIKSENTEHITVWYGQIGKPNTSTKINFSAKYLKPMTEAEFKSLTGIKNTSSSTTYQASSNGIRTSAQGLETIASYTTSNTSTKSQEMRYRLTLDKIYVNSVDDGPEGIFSGYELFGISWCRAYDSKGLQIQPFDVRYSDKYGRFWEVFAKDYIKTDMRYGAQYEIGKQITFDFPIDSKTSLEEVLKKSKIELTVELKDYDTASSSDILGKERVVIPLNEANIPKYTGNHFPSPNQKGIVNIKHGKGHLLVSYYIEKL